LLLSNLELKAIMLLWVLFFMPFLLKNQNVIDLLSNSYRLSIDLFLSSGKM